LFSSVHGTSSEFPQQYLWIINVLYNKTFAGFTRLLQPDKATTNGQAALALASGDASGLVSDELSRLQAEAVAEEAVAAHHAMEVHAREEFKSILDAQLLSEKRQREQLDEFIIEVKAELGKVKAEKELEKDSLWKDRMTVDAELERVHQLRQQIDEQLQALSADQVAVSIQKMNIEKLWIQAEEEKQQISNIKFEINVEKKALSLARYTYIFLIALFCHFEFHF
jgi:hypothetical protein